VPEITHGTNPDPRIEREPGYRTKLAVDSTDSKVDCAVPVSGYAATHQSIIDELNVRAHRHHRWNDDSQTRSRTR